MKRPKMPKLPKPEVSIPKIPRREKAPTEGIEGAMETFYLNSSPAVQRELDQIFLMLELEDMAPESTEKTAGEQVADLILKVKDKVEQLELPFWVSWVPILDDKEKAGFIMMSNRPAEDIEIFTPDHTKQILRGDFRSQADFVRTDYYQYEAPRVAFLVVYQPAVIPILHPKLVDEQTGLPVKILVPFFFVLYSGGAALADVDTIEGKDREENKAYPEEKDFSDALTVTELMSWEELLLVAGPAVRENTFLRSKDENYTEKAWELGLDIADEIDRRRQLTNKRERQSLAKKATDFFWDHFTTILIFAFLVILVLSIVLYLRGLAGTPNPDNGGGSPYYPELIWGLLSNVL